MLQRLFSGKLRRTHHAQGLYRSAVERAREPVFYLTGASDTPEGRFELIALHVIVLIRRCRHEGADGQLLNQTLFDVMFDDMDAALRELGVGDTSIARRIKKMSEAFYGRAQAYGEALDAGDAQALSQALMRNVGLGDKAIAQAWAAYVTACEQRLCAMTLADLVALQTSPFAPLDIEPPQQG